MGKYKKKKEKVAPQRDFGGSEGHKSTDKAHFDKRQDMWIFGRGFPRRKTTDPEKKTNYNYKKILLKASETQINNGTGHSECV